MCQCPYQVCSVVRKTPSEAVDFEQVFLCTITQPLGCIENGPFRHILQLGKLPSGVPGR